MSSSAAEGSTNTKHLIIATLSIQHRKKITQVYRERWHTSLREYLEYTSSSQFRYWELLHYSDLPAPQLAEGSLNDTLLADWFTKDLSLPSSSPDRGPGPEPSSGIRLLIVICDVNPDTHNPIISLTRESYSIIEKELGLPGTYMSQMTSRDIRTTRFSTYKERAKPLKGLAFKLPFYRRHLFYQIALLHDCETSLTQGLLVARREYSLFPQILSSIQDYKPCGCKHPSLLIVLASEPVIDLCVQRLNETDYKMSDLEELIGQHEYSHRLRGNPLELDFIGTTKNINFVTKQLAVDICRLEASLLVLEKIAEWKMETEKNKGDASDQFQVPREIVQGSSVVDEKITYLKDTCRHQLSDAKYQEKRISALIQVVYQFMAEKDAQVNIELSQTSTTLAQASRENSEVMRSIAVETQKDSFAMKTIAVLGMVFLPGTFIAAVFAMPVFDWDGNGMPVIKTGFRYYWLITGPLTILVLISWGVAMLLPWRIWFAKDRVRAV